MQSMAVLAPAVLRDTPAAYFSLLTQDSHPAELE